MAELYPDEKIALIKYSRGGSALEEGASGWGTWAPDFSDSNGINQYDNFLKTVHTALSFDDIDGDAIKDILIPYGIVWMQGESDAYHSEETAKKYEANLKRMIDLFRAAFHQDDLPCVIGRISDSGQDDDGKLMDYLEIVVKAQADFVEKDKNAAFVRSPENYDFLEDGWHYTSKDYIDLGKKFAEALHSLGSKK